MSKLTCGYQGHYCSEHEVQFISRYRNENDYCVGGKRITVYDDGSVKNGCSVREANAILAFEQRQHAEYLAWNEEMTATRDYWPAAEPFTFRIDDQSAGGIL